MTLLWTSSLTTHYSPLTNYGRKFELLKATDQSITKGKDMKKIFGSALIITLLAACQGTGDRTYDMKTNTAEPPTEGINESEGVFDSSASGINKDSSTTMAHDTGAVRKN